MRPSLDDVKSMFSQTPPKIIWQELLDTDPKVVTRLCGYSSKPAREDDLWCYLLRLRYSEPIQRDLFQFLFPACLEKWHEELMSKSFATDIASNLHATLFHARLSNGQSSESLLSAPQCAATLAFMRASLLDRLDLERELLFQGSMEGESVYQWTGFLACYGSLATDVEKLWEEWWSLRTTGSAVAALQYISCLMYPDTQNPVFAAWTPTEGGGPPSLWEYESDDHNSCWRLENITFLERRLSVDYLREVIELAARRLEGDTAYAQVKRIHNDFPACSWLIERRLIELREQLATPDTSIGWTL